MILTLRTDSPDAYIGLYAPDGASLLQYSWRADRQLAKDLLGVIHQQLLAQHAEWQDITGLVVFKGPGSFTGLRIGITVANTLAYSLGVPIAATTGDQWQQNGVDDLRQGKDNRLALPHYGAEAHITQPKK